MSASVAIDAQVFLRIARHTAKNFPAPGKIFFVLYLAQGSS